MRVRTEVEKTIVLSGLTHLAPYFKNRQITNHIFQYNDKIFVKEVIDNYLSDNIRSQRFRIRIWRSNSIFDLWYDRMSSHNFIAALDYQLLEDALKIDYMNINDRENSQLKVVATDYLSDAHAEFVNATLIKYAETVAHQNGKKKVIVDVHQNKRIFNKYYAANGFYVTDRACDDNPFWFEAEKEIYPLETSPRI